MNLQLTFFCFMLTIGTGQAASQVNDQESLLSSTEEVIREVARIRQITEVSPFKKGVRSKEEIRSYIVQRVEEEFPRDEIEAEARLLKKLHLIPPDLDYYPFMLDLLTEQIAGFYDPASDTLYIADWIPPVLQKPVLAHEIAHALQDQIFNLEEFLSPVEGNDDQTLARTALIEGEGLLIMLAYNLEPFGRSIRDLSDIAGMNRAQLPMMEAEYPVFAKAPTYLKESLLFPYSFGADFLIRYLKDHEWKEVDRLYSDVPVSTEQILHPDKYFVERDKPTPVKLPPLGAESGSIVFENVLGEFSLAQVLGVFLPAGESRAATEGWDGDEVRLSLDATGQEVLEILTAWDTHADAEEFAQAMRRLLTAKYEISDLWEESTSDNLRELTGRNAGHLVEIAVSGLTVHVRESDRVVSPTSR